MISFDPSDLKCRECDRGILFTEAKLQVFQNGVARFRVDCNACGGFSHYIPAGEVENLITEWAKETHLPLTKACPRPPGRRGRTGLSRSTPPVGGREGCGEQ